MGECTRWNKVKTTALVADLKDTELIKAEEDFLDAIKRLHKKLDRERLSPEEEEFMKSMSDAMEKLDNSNN